MYDRNHYRENRDEIRAYQREHRRKHRKRYRLYEKRYYHQHQAKLNEANRIWRQQNPEKYKLSKKRSQHKIKHETLSHYSGNPPKCACCGEKEFQFLTLDHKNNDGKQHRATLTGHQKTGDGFYRLLKRLNYPLGFQVLCMNCNWAKAIFGCCPHEQKKTT